MPSAMEAGPGSAGRVTDRRRVLPAGASSTPAWVAPPTTGLSGGMTAGEWPVPGRLAIGSPVTRHGAAEAAPTTTARRWADVRRSGDRGVIRREVLTNLTIDGGGRHVWDVVIGGRTPSPFPGSMGAHSTAWVAHIDEIRRHVVNLSLVDGAKALVGLAREGLQDATSPLRALIPTLPDARRTQLTTSATALTATADVLHGLAGSAYPDPLRLVAQIRMLIDQYLTYQNYLPTATVLGGNPGGHGEGVARGVLNQFEYIYALSRRGQVAATAPADDPATWAAREEAGLGLLEAALHSLSGTENASLLRAAHRAAFDPARCTALRDVIADNLWAMFAPETPGIYASFHGADLEQVWIAAVANFLRTIRSAYPHSFAFTEMHLPANQWKGLLGALGHASVPMAPPLQERLQNALTGGTVPHAGNQAQLRAADRYAEVARSDLQGGGSGFVVTVLLNNSGWVEEVSMVGRTLSPFGGPMGAHSTAWVVHLDALRSQITGADLPTAVATLRRLATASMIPATNPRLRLWTLIDEKHQRNLLDAATALHKTLAINPNPIQQQQFLERLIFDYLTFVNMVPISTTQTGGVPGGRAEGRNRKKLRQYEEFGQLAVPNGLDPQVHLCRCIRAMYDPKSAKSFPPDRFSEELDRLVVDGLTDLFGAGAQRSERKKNGFAEMALTEFHHAVQTAYPKSVEDSGWSFNPAKPALPPMQIKENRRPATDDGGRPAKKQRGDD